MSINVFEGARRIAVLAALLWSAGWLAYAVLSEPDPAMRLAIGGPGKAPVRIEACRPADASRYVNAKLPNRETVRAELCFVAHKADDGRMLVPYENTTVHVELPGKVMKDVPANLTRGQLLARLKAEGYDTSQLTGMLSLPQNEPFSEFTTGGRWNMGEPYSSEVRKYMDGVEEALVLSGEIAADATTLKWRARMSRVWEAALFLLGGLAVGWMAVASIGWVVRGFMGIPRGADRRGT